MNTELFKYFTTDNISGKKCTEKWLSKNNNTLYKSIIDWCNDIPDLNNIEFKRKVFHFINKLNEIPKCKVCNGAVKYKRIYDGYSKYCSDKCTKMSEEYYNKWKKSIDITNSTGEPLKKRYKTLIEKYGQEYKQKIQANREKSIFEKYEVVNPFQIDFVNVKRKQKLKEKYGSETYNNPDKTRLTRINNKTQIDDSLINDFDSYKKIAINRTQTIYRNNSDKINPNKLKRGKKEYHIDHIFSLKQGFLNKIPLSIITHPCNLHMIYYKDNLIKQDSCWISINQLLENIINYNEDININHTILKEEYSKIKDLANLLIR